MLLFDDVAEEGRLVQDSTTVDFAYHVHTDVGNHMVGAKVNGKLVDPDHILGNAEVVEILTYDGQPTRLAVSRHFVSPFLDHNFQPSLLLYAKLSDLQAL